jgi:uncharacterized protein YjbJ (UPF0337 family)
MNVNQAQGTVRDLAGKVQDAAGGLTGDAATQVRGKINQVADQAQRAYGDAVGEVRGFASDQPITAVLTALGVGTILGMFLARR